MGSGQKIKQMVSADELITHLEALLSFFKGEAMPENGPEMKNFEEIKVEIRPADGQFEFKMKVKHPEVKEKPETKKEGQKEKPKKAKAAFKYSTLKKRMKKTFKELMQVSSEERLPPEEAVSAFLEDSEKMVQFKGKGDEDYPAYNTACGMLKSAWKTGDAALLQKALNELDAVAKTCHDKYK